MHRVRTVLLVFAIAACGCAHTAPITAWQPAAIDVSGLNHVVVLGFSGEHGDAVASALTSELWENEFYTLVDRSELQPVMQAGFDADAPADVNSLIEPAKAAGIDGIIVGDVVEYRCDDRVFESTEVGFLNRSKEDSTGEEDLNGFGLSQKQTLQREATVTIAFRLVDVNTGEVRASKRVSKHFDGQLIDGQGTLPPSGAILDDLLTECVDEIVQMLAPHSVPCSMKLATCDWFTRGRRHVARGVKAAENGDWDTAREEWQAALDKNPENDAALFNLALAAAADANFEEAEEFAMEALRLRHKPCYAKGVEEIRRHRTAFEEASQQRDARIVPAEGHFWR